MSAKRIWLVRVLTGLTLLVLLAGAAQAGVLDRLEAALERDDLSKWASWARNRASEVLDLDSYEFSGPSAGAGHSLDGVQTPGIAGQRASTPAITIAELCTFEQCESGTSVFVGTATPGIDSVGLRTKRIRFDGACAELICIGAFSVPAEELASTPAIESIEIAQEAYVPALCSAGACLGEQNIPARTFVVTDDIAPMQITDGVAVAAYVSGLEGAVDSNAGKTWALGPIRMEVPVPMVGMVPVTLCPNTCLLPELAEARLGASVSVSLITQAGTYGATVPMNIRF